MAIAITINNKIYAYHGDDGAEIQMKFIGHYRNEMQNIKRMINVGNVE